MFLSQDILLNVLYASVRIDSSFNGIILFPTEHITANFMWNARLHWTLFSQDE